MSHDDHESDEIDQDGVPSLDSDAGETFPEADGLFDDPIEPMEQYLPEDPEEREQEAALRRDPHLLDGHISGRAEKGSMRPGEREPVAPGEGDPAFIYACMLLPHLASLVLRGARSQADIDDVLQEIRLSLWKAWDLSPDLRTNIKKLLSYLWTALRRRRSNLRRSYARSDRWFTPLVTEAEGDDGDDAVSVKAIDAAIALIDTKAVDALARVERLHLLRFLRVEIAQFPKKRRKVMELVFDKELTYAEVAAEIGTSRQNIEKHVGRAMQVLRERIAVHFKEAQS